MKKLLILSLFLISLSLMGCESNNDYGSSDSHDSDCTEPSNPYGDGGGHDAGFNWAEETGGDCDGNSESFNEGCEEYYSQLEVYENCIE